MLKHMTRYERICGTFLKEPLYQLPLMARMLLCAGCVQLHHMDVPAYAAVHSTVELAKYHRLPHLAGVINAVLKRVAAITLEDYPTLLTDVPAWLHTRLIADYGETVALQIVTSSLQDITYTDLTVKEPSTLPRLQHALNAQHYYGQNIRVHRAGNVTALEGFDAGEWWVQDIAASLPVTLLADIVKSKQILEIGAAPGGKTMQLASYNAQVLAVDRSKTRLKLLQENMARTGLSVPFQQADITRAFPATQAYDMVVVDAPCSATGTIRRNPDILFQRNAQDVMQLMTAQQALLDCAKMHVKQGGMMLYITCSLFHDEGEERINQFLHSHTSWQRVPWQQISTTALPASFFTAAGDYRTQPYFMQENGGMDGLYAALVQRRE
jgi:16S rRNA (cytosine967-C5)-methyltransferase